MRYGLPHLLSNVLVFNLAVLSAGANLVGCADSLPGSVESSEEGAEGEGLDDSVEKGDIYGEDDRRDYFEAESETLRRVGRATAALMYEHKVTSNEDGSVQLPDETLGEDLPACPSVRFSEQPSPSDCSAFLVAPDIIVSAGHCIHNDRECPAIKVVFGFRYDESTDEDVITVPEEDVYTCDSVIAREYDSDANIDHGVYRLDRPVEGVEPLKFRTDGKVPADSQLAVVGHPMGLPLKITPGGEIVDNEPESWFLYNLDAFTGHSGSPVVDVESGVVEGIHVRGAPDYVSQTRDGETCKTMRRCDAVDPESESCSGTEGTRATQFAHEVPTASTGSNGTDSCCSICTDGEQACGDECIPKSETCRVPYGCACERPTED